MWAYSETLIWLPGKYDFHFLLIFDIFMNQLINKALKTSKYTLFGNVHQGIYIQTIYMASPDNYVSLHKMCIH